MGHDSSIKTVRASSQPGRSTGLKPPVFSQAGYATEEIAMKCWICGEEAKTGEHLTKASDLRALFGKVSQKKPIYLHRDKERNLRINTIRSNELKSNALLCADCNNSRTSKHDRAWETLSHYLRSKKNVRVGS